MKSPTFKDWFEEHVVRGCQAAIDLDTVAQMILGKHPEPDKFFLAQIVSSPYDADKLDYIARDSYYCGLALTVDLPRFYSMISTAPFENHRILVLRSYVPLEQVLFSKMTLFGSVYHHQKVKCLDSMLRSLVQHIVDNADQCALRVRGATISFAEATQYLYITDEEFFNQLEGFGDAYVKKMLRRFVERDLFVRCIEISRRTVTNWEDYGRKELISLADSPSRLAQVERDIHRQLPESVAATCNLGDILLSVPGLPSLRKDFAFIQTAPEVRPENIEQFFPLEQWVESYAHNKWKSFVYAPREHARAVRDAAIAVLRDSSIHLDVDLKKSDQACHLNPT